MQKKARKPAEEKQAFTQSQLKAWQLWGEGHKHTDIAKKLGVHQTTVSRWVGSVQDFMKNTDEFQQAIRRLPKLIPFALDVYEYKIKEECSLLASRDVLKMGAIMVEYIKNDNTEVKARLSDSEIREKIKELAGHDKAFIAKLTKKQVKTDEDIPYLDNQEESE